MGGHGRSNRGKSGVGGSWWELGVVGWKGLDEKCEEGEGAYMSLREDPIHNVVGKLN